MIFILIQIYSFLQAAAASSFLLIGDININGLW